ncbi:hypothetical protein IWQ49_003060 [Labrenzia sp. EL_126]|nr:hypothetical protein [Labrenzia sp. EL_126]
MNTDTTKAALEALPLRDLSKDTLAHIVAFLLNELVKARRTGGSG